MVKKIQKLVNVVCERPLDTLDRTLIFVPLPIVVLLFCLFNTFLLETMIKQKKIVMEKKDVPLCRKTGCFQTCIERKLNANDEKFRSKNSFV